MDFFTLYMLLSLFILVYVLSDFIALLIRQQLSPLSKLKGPPCPSFFMGHLAEMSEQENNDLLARWQESYGSSFVYRGFIGGRRLMTTDPVAIAHILGNAYDYPKPDFVRESLATMAAGHDGLLTVEGETHRRQRRILTPAFSASHIKSLTPVFWDKAIKLRDIWLSEAEAGATDSDYTGFTRIDALKWLGRATLDAMGIAGFGYHFDSLINDDNELAKAFAVIFSTARKFRVMTILQVWFPFLRRFRRNSNVMKDAQATMRRIGLGLIEERVQDKDTLGRDILSILVRSNAGASASSESMSAEEVLCQISTFIAAGHETTASALTWCLYALIQNPDIQLKLREELGSVEKRLRQTNPGLSDTDAEPLLTEQLAKCQYLDWFIREALRLHAPITSTMRVCMRDEDVVPVSDTDEVGFCAGNRPAGIRLKKMDIITIPIQAINKSKNLWGDDALLFRPERWAQVPGKAKAIPGLYSSILTFLNGNPVDGNRACIGYKFALLEMKIFLYALVKDIEFRAVPSLVIEKKINVVTRPFVKSEPGLNNQLPVLIRRAVPLDTYMTP